MVRGCFVQEKGGLLPCGCDMSITKEVVRWNISCHFVVVVDADVNVNVNTNIFPASRSIFALVTLTLSLKVESAVEDVREFILLIWL